MANLRTSIHYPMYSAQDKKFILLYPHAQVMIDQLYAKRAQVIKRFKDDQRAVFERGGDALEGFAEIEALKDQYRIELAEIKEQFKLQRKLYRNSP